MRPDLSLKHARKPHELATLQFGKSNTDVWINYITFEIEHGEPKLAGELHARAVKWLDAGLVDKFISDYALLKTNLETSNSKEQTEASQQSTSRGWVIHLKKFGKKNNRNFSDTVKHIIINHKDKTKYHV